MRVGRMQVWGTFFMCMCFCWGASCINVARGIAAVGVRVHPSGLGVRAFLRCVCACAFAQLGEMFERPCGQQFALDALCKRADADLGVRGGAACAGCGG